MMKFDSRAIIKTRNAQLPSRLTVEAGDLTLDIDGYILKTKLSLDQHWEIAEDSFNESGNRLNFGLTGFHSEITNFELEFKLKFLTVRQQVAGETELTFQIRYHELNKKFVVFNADKTINISEDTDLEGVFQQLAKLLSASDTVLKTCFGCLLSGYQKGGSDLYCLKNSREQFLSKPYLEYYQNHYKGLNTELVTEFYYCDRFEVGIRKNKS